MKTAMPAAGTGQQKGPNSPWQCLTTYRTTNASKVKQIGHRFCLICHIHLCQETFNFKESCMLFSVSQGPSVPYQLLENRNEQSCMQFSGLRSWGRTHTWIPFNNLLLSVKLLSHVPISNTWIVFWPCDDCYSPSYCWYGPMTVVIPLVTVVMHLVSVFFT